MPLMTLILIIVAALAAVVAAIAMINETARRSALGPSGPSSVRSLNIGASASCAWQWIRKSSLSDRMTWVSASSTSRARSCAKAAWTAGAFCVNNYSN